MIKNKKLVLIYIIILIFGVLKINIFADTKTLILTGDFLSLRNSEYVLEIKDTDALKALAGKKLGFKIKTTSGSNNKDSKESGSESEEITSILGVRLETTGRNSSEIFEAVKNMLIPDSENKVLTCTLGSSGYNQMESLLMTQLKYRQENVVVEYYDNRINGDPSVSVKVMYKIGKSSSGTYSSSNTGFVMGPELKNSNSTEESKTSKKSETQQDKPVDIKTTVNKILSLLKTQDKIAVRLNKDSDMTVTKKLLSELMYSKYKDKEIRFEKYDQNKLIYRCWIPINDIYSCEKFSVDLSFNNKTIDEILKNKINKYKIISFSQKDSLSAICQFEIPTDFSGYDISKLKVFSVNLDTKTLEEKNINFEIKNNMFIIKTGFGGDYIITDQDI
ncbi:MAG: hypothetical protein J6C55_01395 [Oscillospiraceae bacterium]|nr:hypothetical protein [Oscillospiraceae bacterium]